MVNRVHLAFKANDRSYFAILKKEIHALVLSAGFGETRTAEIDIVVAEMVSNLVKHAGGEPANVAIARFKFHVAIQPYGEESFRRPVKAYVADPGGNVRKTDA